MLQNWLQRRNPQIHLTCRILVSCDGSHVQVSSWMYWIDQTTREVGCCICHRRSNVLWLKLRAEVIYSIMFMTVSICATITQVWTWLNRNLLSRNKFSFVFLVPLSVLVGVLSPIKPLGIISGLTTVSEIQWSSLKLVRKLVQGWMELIKRNEKIQPALLLPIIVTLKLGQGH